MTARARLFQAFALRARPPAGQILRQVAAGNGDRLRQLLAAKTSEELSPTDIRTEVEGNLWMLASEGFRYFIPSFLDASLNAYSSVSVFASELIGALTEPSREAIISGVNRASQALPELGLSIDGLDGAREQQLEWFDSGAPDAIFHDRFDDLTTAEGAVVLEFLIAFQQRHGRDFPFDELQTAIVHHWSRYRR